MMDAMIMTIFQIAFGANVIAFGMLIYGMIKGEV